MNREQGERGGADPGGRYLRWLEALPLAALTLDEGGRVTFHNPQLLQLLGFPDEPVLGANWFDRFVAPEARDVMRELFESALRTGALPADTEHEVISGEGGRRLVRWKNTVLRGEDGGAAVVALLGEDVTEQRQAEADRRLMEQAIQSSGTAIAIAGSTLQLTYVNQAFLHLWGYERSSQVVGRLLSEFWKDEGAADQVAREIAWGGSWSGEMVARRADGGAFTARIAANLFTDRPGSPPRLVATFSDLSERVKLEEQLRHSQKLEAVGLLAGGIAHDFNNLLTVILSGAEFLEDALAPGDPRRADADQILAAARRAEALTRQLLAFSRRQVLHPSLHDLNHAVNGVSKMIRRLIGEDIEVRLSLSAEAPFVLADGALLEQALMNLVVNARDAMPDGGRIEISSQLRELTVSAAAALEIPPGRYAALTVSDTGRGMDEATLARIFEPFFTTKPHGRGTGLGLSTVYGIVRQGGGAVEVKSRPGAGSSFTVLFPAQHPPAHVAKPERRPATTPVPSSGPVILIAEDEPAVRAVAERCLQQRGYRVHSAPDGESALRIAVEMKEIDLLLTDVVMPGMNGRQLAEVFKELRPQTPVLFMSGYTDDTALRLGIETNRVRILSKPFTPDGLAAAVEEAMRGPDAPTETAAANGGAMA
jgi:two-component system cell cycle sensor histidine kinase/response regulator CckA